MKLTKALGLLPYLLFSATLAQAAPAVEQVTIDADTLTLDVPTESLRAEGSVRLQSDGVSLLADSVVYRRLTGDALAEGGVLMKKGEDTLTGDRLSLNLVSQKGELANGELFVKKSNFRVRGKHLEKTGPEDYRVEGGSFTTCDGEKPSWRFEAKEVVVTLEEFATGRDAVFYLGEVPVLYTPYLIFPVKRERQSGLLLPKIGQSSKKGFYIDQPFYWAVTPSQDVTFNLALESSRGVGGGVDYRYLRGGGSHGTLQAFGIYDTEVDKFRGELNQTHLELLSPGTTFASDIHLIADRDYYQDYGENSGEYNRQLLETTVSLTRNWDRYGLTGGMRYLEDLVAADNDATLQRLPALSFSAAGTKAGPLFFSLDSGLINFYREEGVTGQRLDLHPRVTFYAKPTAALDFSLYGGYHQRLYNSSGWEASGVQSAGQADAGSTLSLPLERIYHGRVRHRLIPSLGYGYLQQTGDDELPFFDYGDRVLGHSTVSWSLASVLTAKYLQEGGSAEYRDLLHLKLSQGYQFSGERRDLLTLVDAGHGLTDLMLESRLTPVKGVSLALDGRYNTVDGQVSTADLALGLSGAGASQALLGYRFARDEVEYLEGRVAFPIGSQLSATVLGRYSFDKAGFLESRYALEYKRQCWSVLAAYSDRPDNKSFTVNFSLAGIGALGPIGAF